MRACAGAELQMSFTVPVDSDIPYDCPACGGMGVIVGAAEIDPVQVLVAMVFRCMECRNEWEVTLDQTVQVQSVKSILRADGSRRSSI